MDRIGASAAATSSMTWVFECLAFLHENVGGDQDKGVEYLMQEYRTLQGVVGWERDADLRIKMCNVVSHIVSLRKLDGSKENLVKSRMLVRGVHKKILDVGNVNEDDVPVEAAKMQTLLTEIENRLQE